MKRLLKLGVFASVFVFLVGIAHGENERTKGYYSLVAPGGRMICRTSLQVSVGDEYLNDDNRLYQVVKIEGDLARVRFVRSEKIGLAEREPSLLAAGWETVKAFLLGQNSTGKRTADNRPIAIYYTHSDESYAPSDGRSSILAHGGIYKVGTALADKFRQMGIPVLNDKTPHDPHDSMAYDRSRRTAVQLLQKRPVALLDVHRDAVPPQEYRDVVNDKTVTKVRIVVGRQNPNESVNNAFAKQIKAVVDRQYPGMVRGIYYGKGVYNQDLAPRAILLEFGSNTNTRGAAERGAQIFASAAASVLTAGAVSSSSSNGVHRGAYSALLWILGLIVVGGVGFILLNSGMGGLRRLGKNVKEEFGGDDGHQNDDPSDGNKV